MTKPNILNDVVEDVVKIIMDVKDELKKQTTEPFQKEEVTHVEHT